ncbi:MAG: DNA-binding protein WhiA [Lachnospiraceae bacterium]|nr:DNA-binding protein WhiA [Lachnospiraceae bacterium]
MRPAFSRDTKEYLSRLPVKARHCRLAELHALIAGIGDLGVDETGQLYLLLQSENLAAVRRADYLLGALSGRRTCCSVIRGREGKAPFYAVSLESQTALQQLLKAMGFLYHRGVLKEKTVPAPQTMLQRECCRRAFLRGAFLAGGYVSDPGSSYHFEIVCVSEARAEELRTLLDGFGIRGRLTVRKGRVLVYIKEWEAISDVLSLMGAMSSRLEWENARIYRSLQGQVNRQVNCETANLAKTTQAAEEQIEAIRKIGEKAGLASLPPHLKEIALLRFEHPEASLTELGAMLDPPVGRSGINHRLRKLKEIAEGL